MELKPRVGGSISLFGVRRWGHYVSGSMAIVGALCQQKMLSFSDFHVVRNLKTWECYLICSHSFNKCLYSLSLMSETVKF